MRLGAAIAKDLIEPEWRDLAKHVHRTGLDLLGVVIAKMDATANECEEEVASYPKLVLYPAVKSDRKMRARQVYLGRREFAPMLDFLMENARNLDSAEL